MNDEQSNVILDLLEAATSGNWPNTRDFLIGEMGYSPDDIIDAWNALETMAGRDGTAPGPSDFEENDE